MFCATIGNNRINTLKTLVIVSVPNLLKLFFPASTLTSENNIL